MVSPGAGPDAGSADLEAEPVTAAAIFADRIELARSYVHSLATDGVLRGLIGPREPARLWSRHVLNSAAIAELIASGSSVVDIGSGAGLPGVPLAIARPDLTVTLVEPLERRVRYLDETIDGLGLHNCRAVRGRAEEVVDVCGNADVVTSRAVAPLHRLVTWSAPLARDGGLVLAMKGETAREELDRDRAAVTRSGLVDPEVLEVGGSGSVAPTYVIRARRVAPRGSQRSAGRRRTGR